MTVETEVVAKAQRRRFTAAGTASVTGVVGPLSLADLQRHRRKLVGLSSGERIAAKPYKRTYAWVLEKPRRLRAPVPYRHPAGAQVWVKPSPAVVRKISRRPI